MRVLVTGGEGQVGSQFAPLLAAHECISLGHGQLDVTDEAEVHAALGSARPDLVIHCAAWTDVDGCEREPDRAHRVNAEGTRLVARGAADAGARLVYVSTDFVFDGAKGAPYDERDPTNPINAYGRSKLAGEMHVRRLCPRHYIVRTAWLFGRSRSNFVAKVLSAARRQTRLRMAHDQLGSPTYVRDLAAQIIKVVDGAPFRTYHVTNSGDASRYEWACEIVRLAKLGVEVVPIPSSEWQTPAARPADSRLDNRALREAGIAPMRLYKDALAEVVPALLEMTDAG